MSLLPPLRNKRDANLTLHIRSSLPPYRGISNAVASETMCSHRWSLPKFILIYSLGTFEYVRVDLSNVDIGAFSFRRVVRAWSGFGTPIDLASDSRQNC